MDEYDRSAVEKQMDKLAGGESRPSDVMTAAMSYEPGVGEELVFGSMAELHRYRVSLYNTRKYVAKRSPLGVSGWEALMVRIIKRDPPTLWIGKPTPASVGIVEIRHKVEANTI